jgi:hypothetical protein
MLQVILLIISTIARIPGIADLIKAVILAHTKGKEVVHKRRTKKKEKKNEQANKRGKSTAD